MSRNGPHWNADCSAYEIQIADTVVSATDACGLTITGTASVSGASTLTGATTITGALTLGSTLTIGARAPTYTFPAADGSCGQQLTTDGCAALSWAAASTVAYKSIEGVSDRQAALDRVLNTSIYDFRYDPAKLPPGQWGCTTHLMVGPMAEEAPWVMQGKDKQAFSPINAFGNLALAIQSLAERITELEQKLDTD